LPIKQNDCLLLWFMQAKHWQMMVVVGDRTESVARRRIALTLRRDSRSCLETSQFEKCVRGLRAWFLNPVITVLPTMGDTKTEQSEKHSYSTFIAPIDSSRKGALFYVFSHFLKFLTFRSVLLTKNPLTKIDPKKGGFWGEKCRFFHNATNFSKNIFIIQ
jgi:hypothetical protein